jgi:hypothetical protein
MVVDVCFAAENLPTVWPASSQVLAKAACAACASFPQLEASNSWILEASSPQMVARSAGSFSLL